MTCGGGEGFEIWRCQGDRLAHNILHSIFPARLGSWEGGTHREDNARGPRPHEFEGVYSRIVGRMLVEQPNGYSYVQKYGWFV